MIRGELVFLALVAVAAFGLFNMQVAQEKPLKVKFAHWQAKYNKPYPESEKDYRFGIWMNNYAVVQEHNARYAAGLQTYELETNEFADMNSAEFAAKYLIKLSGYSATGKCTGAQASTDNLPAEVDWSAKGGVTGIKNQGQCGSCWAFSSTGSLEGAFFKFNEHLVSFSEQQLVDCSTAYGNEGCNGGWMNASFFYVIDNGITFENKYPYRGVGGKCNYNPATDKAWQISDCTQVTANIELSLKASIARNPVSVAIEANHISFQLYKSGVYSGNCGTQLDHGVLAVGYGTMNGKKFWKVKNSWGAIWGDKGYIYIENVGNGKGKCGIQMAASYPLP